ncbi:hypothetical protein B296_00008463 [Ensete ventricosum]|uniref:Uncharacterized protein n=1 Tax=Ensete ventricosum TaxID=4639 RepID=A0A427AR85_ENSVE|nr:hypothetical protein B296_00008463 [Ensete ventricosum]
MRRSLGDVAEASSSPRRLRRGEDHDEEVTTSPLEGGVVLRFSSSATFGKDKGRRHLSLRRRTWQRSTRSAALPLESGAVPRFSHFFSSFPFFFLLLPRFFFPRRSQADTVQ